MSRIAAVTRIPSSLFSGLSMSSIGNSLPSFRCPVELDPRSDLLSSASSAERSSSATSRSAKPSGMMLVTCCPRSSSRGSRTAFQPEHSLGRFRRLVDDHHRIRAASSRPRYLPSICARFSSASLRTVMSRIAAVTRIPSSLRSGLSISSIGNSLPSFRCPVSSIPVPICWASASSAERRSSAISRSAKPSGIMLVTCRPGVRRGGSRTASPPEHSEGRFRRPGSPPPSRPARPPDRPRYSAARFLRLWEFARHIRLLQRLFLSQRPQLLLIRILSASGAGPMRLDSASGPRNSASSTESTSRSTIG